MKKLLCFLLCLTLIFSSVSLCFAAVSDSQAASIVSDLSTVKTTLNNIYNRLGTIVNYLYDDSHSIAYWASAIASWMQPIYQALTNNLVSAFDIEPIISGLNEVVSDGTNTTFYPYLKYDGKSNANWLSDIYSKMPSGTYTYYTPSYNSYGLNSITSHGNVNIWNALNNNLLNLMTMNQNDHNDLFYYTKGYPFSIVNVDTAQNETFTPYSFGNALIRYLQKIQYPVARLGYVLASDERIDAQEKASDNEQAVVDNFIDSTGDGAASTSDIGSVSGLSSGFKQNFSSDASPSGIFDIFNADHATWFSQETKNQLDTTTPTRMTKGSESETPLLDKQIEDIYDALGVKRP